MIRTTLALALLVVGCGKSADAPGKDWSGKPLSTATASIADDAIYQKKASFSIEVPAGMKLETRDGRAEWRADVKDEWSEPSIEVRFAPLPESPDDIKSTAMLDADDVVVKNEALPDGFVFVSHTKDHGIVRAETWKKLDADHALYCRASQAKDGGVPSPDKTLAWLESICRSLKVTPGVAP